MNILSIKWFAGFFDVKGLVCFHNKPSIEIVNIGARTSFRIKEILSDIGIEVGRHKREKPSKSSKKPRWDIFLKDEKQILLFLKFIKPYVISKKFQLDLIEEWYSTKEDITKKIKFANNLRNKIISNVDEATKKLKTNNLEEFLDIPLLNDDDSYIVTNSFSDLYYFAGLIDGNGFIRLNHRSEKKKDGKYIPQVNFSNTNKETIKTYCSICKNNSIAYHIYFRKNVTIAEKKRWDIDIVGIKRNKTMLEKVVDKLEIKKEQANLLLQYCKHRLLNPESIDDIGFECKKVLEGMKKGIYT